MLNEIEEYFSVIFYEYIKFVSRVFGIFIIVVQAALLYF